MDIKEIREYLGVSRAEFARRYNIPLRTVENWEGGKSKAPEYLLQLLERAVKEDKKMMKLTDEEIMILDGCTKADAKKHIKNGSLVLDLDSYIDSVEGNGIEWEDVFGGRFASKEEFLNAFNGGLLDGYSSDGLSVVCASDGRHIIEYIL